jgi:ribosomal protein S18 acetylase RimI-like enzyme
VRLQTPTDLSRLCDQHARRDAERTREVIDVGPFRALLDRTTAMIWVNYAVPIAPLAPGASVSQALEELGRVFSVRGRRLRFEFNALPWPELPHMLEQAGLELQDQHPLMVCTPETFTPVAAPGVDVRLLESATADADLRAFQTILRLSFEEHPREVTDGDVDDLRRRLTGGLHLHALAALDGVPAGAASLSPIDEIAELAGLATHPNLRRRGIAATLTSFLTREHFDRGGRMAWLSAADQRAQAAYRKAGYQLIDVRLNYIGPPS